MRYFLLVLAFVPHLVLAEMDQTIMDHSMHHGPITINGPMTPSIKKYIQDNHTMHMGMDIDFVGDPDLDFLRGMIPHHQGAVDMANTQLEFGTNGILKHVTARIIRDQKREIAFMERKLEELEAKHDGKTIFHPSTRAFKRINKIMHQDMNVPYSGNADVDFVAGMIPHHQGAVDMAYVVIKYGKDIQTRRLAYDIINAQLSEISWMRRWQRRIDRIRNNKRYRS